MQENAMALWRKPWVTETLVDVLICTVPIWMAIMMGLFIGWSWRPRWTSILFLGLRSRFQWAWTAIPPGFGARRIWLAFTAVSIFSVCRTMRSVVKVKEAELAASPVSSAGNTEPTARPPMGSGEREQAVSEDDLDQFLGFMEGRNGSVVWQIIMEKTTPNMTYNAWCHDPQNGPFVLRSRSVFEDATPELVRDFFWDDEFRKKWDPMIGHCQVLEAYPNSGLMIVKWVRKFPFFCSDREYITAQRIWEDGNAYYCVTKSVQYPDSPSRKKVKRVEVYSSCWMIKAVEARKGGGQKSACEVILIHYEDMGIPKDVAKVGVRHGMWGAVKRLHGGLRSYQIFRRSASQIGTSARMASVTTKLSIQDNSQPVFRQGEMKGPSPAKGFDWKWLFLGGTIALVCVHSGFVGRALLLGAGRKFARR